MPWENNGGGGGRNNGGPWGQAPGGGGGGPRRPSNNTPNLEDILNRGRAQFGGGLPGEPFTSQEITIPPPIIEDKLFTIEKYEINTVIP